MKLKCGVAIYFDCLKNGVIVNGGKHNRYLVLNDSIRVPITHKESKYISLFLAGYHKEAMAKTTAKADARYNLNGYNKHD